MRPRRRESAADERDGPQQLRERALRLLARREHSRSELAAKLARHADSRDSIDELLDALERGKQLSDERYAESRVRVLSRKFGAARILRELGAKGVKGALPERMAGELAAGELQRAREILRRRYRLPPEDIAERAKRSRFLQGRGFSYDVIRRALDERALDEPGDP